jgi:hypothetical protein
MRRAISCYVEKFQILKENDIPESIVGSPSKRNRLKEKVRGMEF